MLALAVLSRLAARLIQTRPNRHAHPWPCHVYRPSARLAAIAEKTQLVLNGASQWVRKKKAAPKLGRPQQAEQKWWVLRLEDAGLTPAADPLHQPGPKGGAGQPSSSPRPSEAVNSLRQSLLRLPSIHNTATLPLLPRQSREVLTVALACVKPGTGPSNV